VGQVGNLRRIVNPPAGSEHNAGESPEKFAACRYVEQPILSEALQRAGFYSKRRSPRDSPNSLSLALFCEFTLAN
jgi:hypothetical protein